VSFRQSKIILWAVIGMVLSQFSGLSGSAIATPLDMPSYPWDMRRTTPKAYRAYLKMLTPELKRTDWAGRLNGTGTPVELIRIDGRRYLSGLVCKPHECADSFIVFLVAVDGSRAVALVRSDETRGEIVELGTPAVSERQHLDQQLSNEANQ
jgi:hypothetical protein